MQSWTNLHNRMPQWFRFQCSIFFGWFLLSIMFGWFLRTAVDGISMYINQNRIPRECHWHLRIAKDSFLLMVLVTPIYSEDFHLTDFFWVIRSWWFFEVGIHPYSLHTFSCPPFLVPDKVSENFGSWVFVGSTLFILFWKMLTTLNHLG